MKPTLSLPTLAIAALTTLPASAEVNQQNDLVITATRQDISLRDIPHAVTVLEREDIQSQLAVSRNLAEVLSKVVPGMAPASQTLTNFNQSLRGRNMLILVDGVPQNTNRNASRDLMTVDPANIERIEVVRGGSAVYGSGAAGGMVNIITRRNVSESVTTVGLSTSLSNLSKDGLGNRLEHYSGGNNGSFDYGFNLAAEQRRGFFDADGDRIAPEPSQGDLSDTDSLSLAGKLRWQNDDSRVTLAINHYVADQDTDFASDASVMAAPAGTVKAQALEGIQLDKQNETRNSQINLSLQQDNTVIGDIESQLYYRSFEARFAPFDGRPYGGWNHLAQSYLESESWGGRLGVSSDLSERSVIRWGLDLSREKTSMPVTTYDGTAFDSSNGLVFIDTGDKDFVPELTHDTAAIFAQLETEFGDNWRWQLGSRYEHVNAAFNDFTTLGQQNAIEGGESSYSDVLWNTGVIYDLNSESELYASFSQGFELPDIGLRIRYASADFDISSSELKPIKTDNYELGYRGDWGNTQGSVALFYNTSDLGSVVTQDFSLAQARRKERVYGLELALEHRLDASWAVGGNLSWLKGENYDENDQRWEALNGYRIPPLQMHAWLNWQQSEDWAHLLQLNYSGSRDDAFKDQVGFGSREVQSYTTVDLLSRYQLRRGELSIGIENLLNKQYYTVYGQLLRNNNNSSHIPANGALLRLNYAQRW